MNYNQEQLNKILYAKTIHQLFEEQVTQTPHNIALVYEDKEFTYTNLNVVANQLANYIYLNYNIIGDDLIALYLERSEYMLIAMLATMKSGGAYVPIDPNYPDERTALILRDTKAKVIITNDLLYNRLVNLIEKHQLKIEIIVPDNKDTQTKLFKQENKNPETRICSNNLVYVTYTSGSTGTPKGVMVEHKALVGIINKLISLNQSSHFKSIMCRISYVFGPIWKEIYLALLTGAKLVLLSEESRNSPEKVLQAVNQYEVNLLMFVPSQLRAFTEYYANKNLFFKPCLNTIFVFGETLTTDDLAYVFLQNPSLVVKNQYGNTECLCQFEYIIRNDILAQPVLMGKAIANTAIYILDNNMVRAPSGEIGELYIGGDSISRGYLNQPQLNIEKYLSNPFQTPDEKKLGTNARIYKTGDLVRLLENGNVEYIGRNDFQVKIRGIRIELAEIEQQLIKIPGIKYAIVVAKTKYNNQQYLAAYYVLDKEINLKLNNTLILDNTLDGRCNQIVKLSPEKILDKLALVLPDYMLPSYLIELESIPLAINGKVDRGSLPKPKFFEIENYIAPTTKLEEKICAAYAEVLHFDTKEISVNDNFFKLGGNSLLAIRLTFKLANYLTLSVNDIFQYKTPAKLAQFLPTKSTNLVDRLAQINSLYLKLAHDEQIYHGAIEYEHTLYQQQLHDFSWEYKKRTTSNILLTGATGYLGCHLLYQLLSSTTHQLYLTVRASSDDEAHVRLWNKFKHYFDKDLNSYNNRLNIITADISKENLGLNNLLYKELVNKIGTIIHSAAQVKFYGNYEDFYIHNVLATENLLEFANLTKMKDFHYISSLWIFTNLRTSNRSFNIFTENDIIDEYANLNSLYTKTKYLGEQTVIKYRKYGVKTNIYRVGNLGVNSVTNKPQQNTEDNAFFQRLKTVLQLGMIPNELSHIEISPVNSTALAITLIFNNERLSNQILHVSNPYKSNLYELLNHNNMDIVKQVPLSVFIDTMVHKLANNVQTEQIELYMLLQNWLDPNIKNMAKKIIFQDKTDLILSKLSFQWPKITHTMLSDLLSLV